MHGENEGRVESLGWGATLVGGLIGAAIGVALHVAVETGMLGMQPREALWFPVIIGLLTGAGAWLANKPNIHRVSYLRGALTAVLALAAIFVSTQAIAYVMANRSPATQVAAAEPADPAIDKAAEDEASAGVAPAEAEPMPAAAAPVRLGTGQVGRPKAPGDLNPKQFIFMALGAFLAYELGRGTGRSKAEAAPPREPEVAD